MGRLIDADVIIESIKNLMNNGATIEQAIEAQPTVYDVDEVVQMQQRKESNQTKTTDGITNCCGYDFGLDQYNKRIRFCPICGNRIIN